MSDEKNKVQREIEKLGSAVDGFAAVMKARLERKALDGYTGWDDPAKVADISLTTFLLSDALSYSHEMTLGGGGTNPDLLVDIANRAMFLWLRKDNG